MTPSVRLLAMRTAASWLVASALAVAQAQEVERTPLPANHPVIGLWRFDLPNTKCHELYDMRADGSTRITSGAQDIESIFRISAAPSAKGFHEWVDKITKANGKRDCSGELMEVGDETTNFILVHPSGKQFMLCEEEDTATCVGPFIRQEGT